MLWDITMQPCARGPGVSDSARTKRVQRTVSCPRCGTTMEEVVRIAPISGGPGLVAYECPNCVYVTSEIVRPKEAVLAPRVREFGPLLKCPDHPFVEARGIALSAFRDFDDRFSNRPFGVKRFQTIHRCRCRCRS